MNNSWWHQAGREEVLEYWESGYDGLNDIQIKTRQEIYKNVLTEGEKLSPYKIFLNQFTDTMVLVLLAATIVSGAIGAMMDAAVILAIVVLNAILGLVQEYRAEKSLEAIKKMVSPFANVIRNGNNEKILATDLVPGDILLLEPGDIVAADVRLLETVGMQVDEAALTGESHPVEKNADLIYENEMPLAEQRNMAFMGTAVTRGRAKAVVVSTGVDSVMGQIAKMIDESKNELTPLQRKLDQLGKNMIIICLSVCLLVTLLGIMRGEELLVMFMTGISLAVAAIPEGLPAIVTVVLALGVQRMAKRQAIVRKLPAVETLGCVTVICSDKTGTLTQNKMSVLKLAVMDNKAVIGNKIEISGEGYCPQGVFKDEKGKIIKFQQNSALHRIMQVAYNCNNSKLIKRKGQYEVSGDPTEGALLAMAGKAGIPLESQRIREVPFDSERKRMTVVVAEKDSCYVLVKGALDSLLPYCSQVMTNGKVKDILAQDVAAITSVQEEWADMALRVLGFAFKPVERHKVQNLSDAELEQNLILLGICGMIDPPRPGVADSVRQCQDAGIVPIMISGDHPKTAQAIAWQIGISDVKRVITGIELEKMADADLYDAAIKYRVFARVAPQHKNRIVKILRQKRQVVAMTGDGVNDAPAVKSADIGVAMGIAGTEVTKEASAMVLVDDNFSTIVHAVYEGRAIYDNIRKFIRYLLGCNIGEVLVMLLASLLGMPLPLLPIQILWVNLVTDGLPAMALGTEPPEPGIMKRKPRPGDEGVFARGLGWTVLGRGIYIGIVTLLSFSIGYVYAGYQGIYDLNLARTMAFTTLVIAQLFYVFECRSETYSPFELGFLKNRFLILAVAGSVIMQLCVLYTPKMQNVFQVEPLTWQMWCLILVLAGIKFIWKLLLYIGNKVLVLIPAYAKIGIK